MHISRLRSDVHTLKRKGRVHPVLESVQAVLSWVGRDNRHATSFVHHVGISHHVNKQREAEVLPGNGQERINEHCTSQEVEAGADWSQADGAACRLMKAMYGMYRFLTRRRS